MTPPRETPDCKKMRQRLDGKTSSERARYVVRLVQEARDAALAEVEQMIRATAQRCPDHGLGHMCDQFGCESFDDLADEVVALRKETDTP